MPNDRAWRQIGGHVCGFAAASRPRTVIGIWADAQRRERLQRPASRPSGQARVLVAGPACRTLDDADVPHRGRRVRAGRIRLITCEAGCAQSNLLSMD